MTPPMPDPPRTLLEFAKDEWDKIQFAFYPTDSLRSQFKAPVGLEKKKEK